MPRAPGASHIAGPSPALGPLECQLAVGTNWWLLTSVGGIPIKSWAECAKARLARVAHKSVLRWDLAVWRRAPPALLRPLLLAAARPSGDADTNPWSDDGPRRPTGPVNRRKPALVRAVGYAYWHLLLCSFGWGVGPRLWAVQQAVRLPSARALPLLAPARSSGAVPFPLGAKSWHPSRTCKPILRAAWLWEFLSQQFFYWRG